MVLVWQKLRHRVVESLIAERHRPIWLQRPQPGRAAHSAGISMLRWKNRGVRFPAENVSLQTGRHIASPRNTPLCNLYLSMLDCMGIELPRFGDSTEMLRGLK